MAKKLNEKQQVERIRKLLESMNLKDVSRDIDSGYDTLWRFAQGKTPSHELVVKLKGYFKERSL